MPVFIIIVAGFLALPFKAIIKVDNSPALELEQFNFRRSTFTTHYKPQLTQRDQNLIFAVVDRQRDVNPPERPLVFLLMTPALTKTNLEFANDLGRLARGQDVKAIQSQQVRSRNSLMDELTKSFRDDKGAIIEHFEEMPSDAALAFYGIRVLIQYRKL
ncbi:unnamed protein product [Oikopleura dioica]|uniref:Hexosyltransferase n=1 Tax=Oikopleura dioica TaxID=34765 RepID=E4YFK6_OIKDI|nr:unnamed protein product [Oikopleura dioica]